MAGKCGDGGLESADECCIGWLMEGLLHIDSIDLFTASATLLCSSCFHILKVICLQHWFYSYSSQEVNNGSISILIHQYPLSSRGLSSAAKTRPTQFEDLKMRFEMLAHDAKIDTIENSEEAVSICPFILSKLVSINQRKYMNTTWRGTIDSTQSWTRNWTVRIHSRFFLATCRHHATPSITQVTDPLQEATFG